MEGRVACFQPGQEICHRKLVGYKLRNSAFRLAPKIKRLKSLQVAKTLPAKILRLLLQGQLHLPLAQVLRNKIQALPLRAQDRHIHTSRANLFTNRNNPQSTFTQDKYWIEF